MGVNDEWCRTVSADEMAIMYAQCEVSGSCLVFPQTNNYGYARVRIRGMRVSGARLVLITTGRWPPDSPDIMACHICDNPPCVRPAHLYWGDTADNVADRLQPGRVPVPGIATGTPRGDKNGSAKLREGDVPAIRAMAHRGVTYGAIAKQYGVSASTIRGVALRLTWAHVA